LLARSFDALLAAAQEIVSVRTCPATQQQFLKFLSKIDESDLLLLAMMADAGDENMVLLRH
jgi:hypothetical protein